MTGLAVLVWSRGPKAWTRGLAVFGGRVLLQPVCWAAPAPREGLQGMCQEKPGGGSFLREAASWRGHTPTL